MKLNSSTPPARLTDGAIRRLKSLETLQAFAKKYLTPAKEQGGKLFCHCPFGTHVEKPYHLEIKTDETGDGVFICRACRVGGAIHNLAGHLWGMDADKEFGTIMRRISAEFGIPIDEEPAPARRRSGGRKSQTPPPAPAPAPNPAEPAEPAEPAKAAKAATPAQAAAAWQTVDALSANPEAQDRIAAMFSLPREAIAACASREAALPVGLTPYGQATFIYSRKTPEGKRAVAAVKCRTAGREEERMPQLNEKGTWYECTNVPMQKFCAAIKGLGIPALWGADAIREGDHVLIAEGESDAIALQYAMTRHAADAPDPQPYAVTAKAGAGAFKPAMAEPLQGKAVTILADNDANETGDKGAKNTAAIIAAAGAAEVRIWNPPAGVKDFRAFLIDTGDAAAAARDVLEGAKTWTPDPEPQPELPSNPATLSAALQAQDAEQAARKAEAALQAFSESADGERLDLIEKSLEGAKYREKDLKSNLRRAKNRGKALKAALNADKDNADLKTQLEDIETGIKRVTRELVEIADGIAAEEQERAPLAEQKDKLEAEAKKARRAADKAADRAARAAGKNKPIPLTAAPDALSPCPVKVLGGDGKQVQFYLNSAHRVLTLPTRGLTPALLTRAGVEAEEWNDWIASSSPADDEDPEGGVAADPAILSYFLDAEIARRLKSTRGLCVIRGRGVWKRASGEPCYCDGIDVYSPEGERLDVLDGRTVYYSEDTMPLPNREGLTKELAAAYLQLLESRTWTSPHMATVLAGWNVAALIGGALEYRPHVWITGTPGVGKSAVMADERRILQGAHVTMTGADSTEAGTRQATAGTSLPVIVDELEKAANKKDREQQQRIIKQARKNTDAQPPTVQGIAGGGGKVTYVSANSYLFASVRDGLTESQDANRFFKLTLDTAHGDELRRVLEAAREARRIIEGTPDFAARLIGHALIHYGDIIKRAEEIREQLEAGLVDSRRAKLQAVTQAAAESVMLVAGRSKLPIAPWDESKSDINTATREAERLVEAVLGYRDNRTGMTIRAAVKAAARESLSVEKQQATALLTSYGLKYLSKTKGLAIRHTAKEFLDMLKDDGELPWTTGADVMATARDAKKAHCDILTLKPAKFSRSENIPNAPVILSAALDLPQLDADGNEIEEEDEEEAEEV